MSSLLFEDLPSELLSQIYLHATSISDILALSSTCRRLRSIFQSSHKLEYFSHAIEAEYGPIADAIQLVTHNASQPAHAPRSAPLSMALLRQLVAVGRVARAWEDIYPFKRWHDNFEDRRLLTPAERYALRRALYRLWLYSRAFHNAAHPRHRRTLAVEVRERAQLLQNFSGAELAEMADVQAVLRDVLKTSVCPSNGTVLRKFRRRWPDSQYQLCFNLHLNYPPPHVGPGAGAGEDKYHAKYRPTPYWDPGCEGWGDDLSHYYVIEDYLKLDPGQILWLKNNASAKIQVEAYVRGLGGWFENNGATFGETLEVVLRGREHDIDEFLEGVAGGEMGVAVAL